MGSVRPAQSVCPNVPWPACEASLLGKSPSPRLYEHAIPTAWWRGVGEKRAFQEQHVCCCVTAFSEFNTAV